MCDIVSDEFAHFCVAAAFCYDAKVTFAGFGTNVCTRPDSKIKPLTIELSIHR
jgi:hypothetical protein